MNHYKPPTCNGCNDLATSKTLDPHGSFHLLQVDDFVHQQKRITMRQNLRDLDVVLPGVSPWVLGYHPGISSLMNQFVDEMVEACGYHQGCGITMQMLP